MSKLAILPALLNSLRDAIIIVDSEHVIVFVNQSAIGLLGYQRTLLVGAVFEDAVQLQVNGERVSKDTSPITKAQKKHGIYISDSEPDLKLSMGRNDRSLVPVQISVVPDEDLNSYNVIFHDGSADEKIDQAKNEFVALVSHQLRTPVNIISWYIEKLLTEKKGTLNEKQREYLREIEISNKRVVDLVQAIVNVSRTDLSRLKHKHEEVDFANVLEKVLVSVQELSHQKSITFDKVIDKGDYLLNDSDQELSSIVLKSILINAIRYTPKGGKVTVNASTVTEGQKLSEDQNIIASVKGVLVSIEDNGIGIPDEEKIRIFTKLYRATNVQTLDVTGVGLGLYIAQNFMSILGGRIWFTSDLREGSIFYIYYPCVQIGIL